MDTHTYEMCLVARPPEVLGQQGVAGVQAIGVIPANTRPLQTQPVGVVAGQQGGSGGRTLGVEIGLVQQDLQTSLLN